MKHIYVQLIVPASVIMPITAGIINRVYKNKKLNSILWYLVFVLFAGIVAVITARQGINNLPVLHFYTIAELLFILRYFQLVIISKTASRVILWLMLLFPVLCTLNFIFIQDIHQFNSYPRPLAALIIVAFCMYYFFIYVNNQSKQAWALQPQNWITAGLLTYFSGAFLYFAFANIIHQKASLTMRFIFNDLHATLVMIMYILFSIAFIKQKNE